MTFLTFSLIENVERIKKQTFKWWHFCMNASTWSTDLDFVLFLGQLHSFFSYHDMLIFKWSSAHFTDVLIESPVATHSTTRQLHRASNPKGTARDCWTDRPSHCSHNIKSVGTSSGGLSLNAVESSEREHPQEIQKGEFYTDVCS